MGFWNTLKQVDQQFGVTTVALVALTVLLMLLQHFALDRSLIIHPDSNRTLSYRSMDQFVEGGQSIEELSLDEQGNLVINCEINIDGSGFYFCSAIIQLMSDGKGIDLTQYETMTIDMEFTSTQADTVLFYLLHTPDQKSPIGYEIKANMTATLPSNDRSEYVFSLNDFYVPSWWLAANGINQSSAATELTNVIELQIATGDSRLDRMERITIRGIRFDGKWLSSNELNLGIIIFWFSFYVLRLIFKYRDVSQSLADHQSSVTTLKSLNKLLNIEKKKFAKMAQRDDLTQLYNRAGARDIILRVQEAFRMNGDTSALILFDIDNFKEINDKHGHAAGDKVLIDIAELLLKNTRTDDHVIRWGGEEFVIICEHSPVVKTVQLAEKIRTLIMEKRFDEDIELTCSFGVTEIKSDESQTWFEQADRNLYEAKQQGKNKVVS